MKEDFTKGLTPDESAKQLVIDRLNTAKEYRKANYDKKWDSYQMQYRSKLEEEKKKKNMAKLYIPQSFTSIETTIPRMVEAIFAGDPIVAVKPWERKDLENAEILERLLLYQYSRMDFFNNFIMLAKMCLIYGTTIGKVGWRNEAVYKKRPKMEASLDEMGQVIEVPAQGKDGRLLLEKYSIETWNDPYIWPVDIYKFFIDPKALTIEDAEYVIMVGETTIERLSYMQELGIYKNVPKIDDVKGKIRTEEGRERYTNVGIQSPEDVTDRYSDKVTFYEYWENDRTITLIEEDVVIRDEGNPYWHLKKPFVSSTICSVENEFNGIGLMEMTQSLQNELNDVRNQRMDNITLSLNRMYLIARDADVDPSMLINAPGGGIYVNYVEGIKPLDTPDVTSQAFHEADVIKRDMEEVLGNYEYSRGQSGSKRETATGILSLQEVANIRFKMMIMKMTRNLLSASSAQIVDLNQQFLPQGKAFRLTGEDFNEEWYNITPEELVGRFDYEPVGASMEGLSKYARLEQLLRFRQIFASNPQFNLVKLDTELLKLLNFKNSDEYFVQQPPVPPGTDMGQGQGMGQVGFPTAEMEGMPPGGLAGTL